jgi:hypothetical protein
MRVLFEPVWFINSRCIIVIAAIANGIRKCNAKNRIGVALSTGMVQPAGREHTEQTNSLFLSGFKARSCSILVLCSGLPLLFLDFISVR